MEDNVEIVENLSSERPDNNGNNTPKYKICFNLSYQCIR
jgi:hypothetical protein